ncbi:hypothetical protein LSTR_LSTR003325 [Laodelphax striatellus]|uniref:PPM-type phosphatase domain-containing protein n=1 Tax=Laodelphax striatellus TaxID=195883 RepID=A0A482X4I5_LAOST|nr:hypothetical protein LSTR_LSTR003325 [Laodelphax striatellus]
MAVGSVYKYVFSNRYISGQCSFQNTNNSKFFRKILWQFKRQKIHTSSRVLAQPRLSPQEVTTILRTNEYSREFHIPGSVKSYDSNQLPSNQPMEDARCEAKSLLTAGMLMGVFDGHGGASCAQVIAKRLFDYITISLLPQDLLQKYLQSLESGSNTAMPLLECFNDKYDLIEELKQIYAEGLKGFVRDLSSSRKDFEMSQALKEAFLRLDGDLSREALTTNNKDGLKLKTLSVALSGAVACVVHIDGVHLHVANVGDCQAVLGVLSDTDTWSAKKLSIEHNTDNFEEVKRIINEHPSNEKDTVIRMERLLGQLAPLRAFGDFRYKWSRTVMSEHLIPYAGEQSVPPNYYTPPYLTALPDIVHHRLTPRDRFLVIASDGLWDLISPLQVVRLVGEHMSGKVTLSPLRLPKKEMRLGEINNMLIQRQQGLKVKPQDRNAATHLMRHALGGTEYGIEHSKIAQLLSMPQEVVRLFRDDITITVVYFDPEYLRQSPP